MMISSATESNSFNIFQLWLLPLVVDALFAPVSDLQDSQPNSNQVFIMISKT